MSKFTCAMNRKICLKCANLQLKIYYNLLGLNNQKKLEKLEIDDVIEIENPEKLLNFMTLMFY